MPEGYLPLCRLAAEQPIPGGRSIDRQSLLAIRCPQPQQQGRQAIVFSL